MKKQTTTALLLPIALLITLLAGCTNPNPDVVTTASVVKTNFAFESALGTNGSWIIAPINDLIFDKDLILQGEFENGQQDEAGNNIIQRIIALYSRDEDDNITVRFTLTAPKLTIESPNASIQHGTFKGDLYVNADNFQLIDTTVEGNVYFATEQIQSTFTMDGTSVVTGVQQV